MQFIKKTSSRTNILGLIMKLALVLVLILGIVFLLIQGVSELFKSYWAATKGQWPGEEK